MTLSIPAAGQALLDETWSLPVDRPFTTATAKEAGIAPSTLTRLTSGGLLRRVLKGVYVAAQVKDSTVTRGRALALVLPPGSVLTDWTACWYWTGVDRPNSHLAVPDLSVFRFRGHERLRNRLVTSGERWFKPSDVLPLDGDLRVTTPIRTAWDLGRFFPPVIALGGMDALLRRGDFERPELREGVERFAKQRGVVQLRVLAPLADGRAESPGESGLRWRWYEVPGLPRPQLQIPVVDESGFEVFRIDLGVEELRFGAEYDGEEWHDEQARPRDEWRRGKLDEEHRWHIEGFRRQNVYGAQQDSGARLRRGILIARRRLGTPRHQ